MAAITGGGRAGDAGDKRDATKLAQVYNNRNIKEILMINEQGCSELGVEHCQCMMSKIAKNLIFGLSRR